MESQAFLMLKLLLRAKALLVKQLSRHVRLALCILQSKKQNEMGLIRLTQDKDSEEVKVEAMLYLQTQDKSRSLKVLKQRMMNSHYHLIQPAANSQPAGLIIDRRPKKV